MTPAEQELRLEELQIELERERKHSRDLLASYRDLKDSTGCIYHDEAATWIKSKKTETVGGYAALFGATGQNSHVNAVKWIRDAMSNIKSLTSKCSQLTDELEGLKNAVDFWRASRDDWQDKWQQLVDATSVSCDDSMHSHADALNWIKMAASVIPGCVDSTKEKIAALAENEELKRKVAEIRAKVDNQQEELLDCRATVNFTQDSRDYWRGACSKLTRAIGIDAINDAVEWVQNAARKITALEACIKHTIDEKNREIEGLKTSLSEAADEAYVTLNQHVGEATRKDLEIGGLKDLLDDQRELCSDAIEARNVTHLCLIELKNAIGEKSQDKALEWIKNAKRDLLSLAEIGRTKDWQISDLSRQLVLAKDRGNKQFDRASGLISATGTYSYDHALGWIERHRRSEEAYSLLGDKV